MLIAQPIMTTLQFTLFFVALVLALALVHVQMARMQTKLDALQRLARIEERLGTLVQAVEQVQLEPIEKEVRELRGDLRAVTEALERVELAASRPVTIPAPVPSEERRGRAAPEAPGVRVRALVEGHLASLGYTKVRILNDLAALASGDDAEVLVECERGTMPCKGKVVLRAGVVQDAQITMLAQMFP